MWHKFIKLLWSVLSRVQITRLLSDVWFTKLMYYVYTGRWLNLDNSDDFNQKVQWLKLYYRNPLVVEYADKYLVRRMVANRIGNQFMTKCIGVYDSVQEINIDCLPRQFVLKCTHASGWNIICQDKSRLDWPKAKKRLDRWMHRDFSVVGREWQYHQITPKIICEEFLPELEAGTFKDYRIFVFNGEPRYLLVEFSKPIDGDWNLSNAKVGANKPNKRRNMQPYANFYTADWRLIKDVSVGVASSDGHLVVKPKCLDWMLESSRRLAAGFPFCRVDFYVIEDSRALFSELTFSPAKGCYQFTSQSFAVEMGKCLNLPDDGQKKIKR